METLESSLQKIVDTIDVNKNEDYQTCFNLYNREEISLVNKEMELCILEKSIVYSKKCEEEINSKQSYDMKCPEVYQKMREIMP